MNFRRILSHTLMAAAAEGGEGGGGAPPAGDGGTPPAGGGEAKPEMAKITLPGGIVVDMPKAQAEAFMAARTKEKAEREELARKVGAVEAERKKAEDQAAAAAQEKEVLRLAKEGELAKVREILTRESEARLARLSARVVDQELAGNIRRLAPGLADQAVADTVALVRARAGIDPETGTIRMIGEDGQPLMRDGQPVGADAYLAEWLAARPHFQVAKVPAGTGGKPAPTSGTPGTIRRADLANLTATQAEALRTGRLKVVD